MNKAWADLRRQGPDPLVAVALSAVWPGLGHFGHNNARALLLTNLTLAAAVAGVGYAATRSLGTLLTWSLNPSLLRALIAATLCILVFRIAVAADAYRTAAVRYGTGSGGVARRVGTLATLVVVAVIMAAPHAITIRFALAQLDLLSAVFDTTVTRTATPTPVPATTLPTTLPSTSVPERSTSLPTLAHTTSAPSTTEPVPTWDGADRLTIALLGSDAGFDRHGVRTDTIIVVSFDVATGDAAAFSVPRNWHHVPFPEGTPAHERWPEGYPGIANEIYGLGLRHPEAFPHVEDAAGHAVKSALAQLTGLDIQFYVLIDMVGFVKLIDLFGGIDLHVSESINDRIKPIVPDGPHIDIVVEPGVHHFDGLTSLGYVRSRTSSTDWHRMTRQRCVIEALIDQIPPLEVIYNYAKFVDIISDHIQTDVPLDRLEELIFLTDRLDTSRIVTVNFIPPEFQDGDAPVVQVREAVAQALQGTSGEANAFLRDRCKAPS